MTVTQALADTEIDSVDGGIGLIPISFDLAALPGSRPSFGPTPTQTLYGIGYDFGGGYAGVGTNFNAFGATVSLSF